MLDLFLTNIMLYNSISYIINLSPNSDLLFASSFHFSKLICYIIWLHENGKLYIKCSVLHSVEHCVVYGVKHHVMK